MNWPGVSAAKHHVPTHTPHANKSPNFPGNILLESNETTFTRANANFECTSTAWGTGLVSISGVGLSKAPEKARCTHSVSKT
jgi:hypothetical protein